MSGQLIGLTEFNFSMMSSSYLSKLIFTSSCDNGPDAIIFGSSKGTSDIVKTIVFLFFKKLANFPPLICEKCFLIALISFIL